MGNEPEVQGAQAADAPEIRRQRRKLIWSAVLTALLLVAAVGGLSAFLFTPDRQHWTDESRVVQVRGVVLDEVTGSGSCKGADYDTLVEWTQDGEARSAWARTCRSGPDVGDTVDVWVRDDGQITLTEPATTTVFIVVGALFFLGMGLLCFFSFRSRFRSLGTSNSAP